MQLTKVTTVGPSSQVMQYILFTKLTTINTTLIKSFLNMEKQRQHSTGSEYELKQICSSILAVGKDKK